MSILFSFGKYGGFYFRWGYTKRLCLGWFAITFCPFDIDEVFDFAYEGNPADKDEF